MADGFVDPPPLDEVMQGLVVSPVAVPAPAPVGVPAPVATPTPIAVPAPIADPAPVAEHEPEDDDKRDADWHRARRFHQRQEEREEERKKMPPVPKQKEGFRFVRVNGLERASIYKAKMFPDLAEAKFIHSKSEPKEMKGFVASASPDGEPKQLFVFRSKPNMNRFLKDKHLHFIVEAVFEDYSYR
eukprot:gb/GEZN01020927.1/.p1 GENE.gb/GEZN01020927.1/~~gb/GEZN01020927.1/.p1  ORF type:complete len:186 (-),score=26.81 gb/GEZN01020927.1/:85-642(-)